MEAPALALLIILFVFLLALLLFISYRSRSGMGQRVPQTGESGQAHDWKRFSNMLISLDIYPTSTDVEIGELLISVSVTAANVVNDIRENIRNLVGGRMQHYEKLIERSITTALADLEAKAKAKGYDGVIGVKISHPTVVDGGVEVIVYGNGFKRRAS